MRQDPTVLVLTERLRLEPIAERHGCRRDIVHDGFGFVLYGLTAEQASSADLELTWPQSGGRAR